MLSLLLFEGYLTISNIPQDNSGPPEVPEVLSNFAQLRSQFPNAKVIGSTYDDFVQKLLSVKNQLPIVQDEIGDTWIQGVPSDPERVALYRAFLRARLQCLQLGQCNRSDTDYKRFNFLLVKIAEHTWGLDIKTFLHDFVNWSNQLFEQNRNQSNFLNCELSWDEQRQYLLSAVTVLHNEDLLNLLVNELDQYSVGVPSTRGFTQITNFDELIDVGFAVLKLDANSGGINYYYDKKMGQNFADETHLLAQFAYQTLNADNFTNYLNSYLYCPLKDCLWALGVCIILHL